MFRVKKRILGTLIAFISLISIVFFQASAIKADENVVITIFHTNDMHASVELLPNVKTLRDQTPNSLLVDAGDAIQGKPLGTYTRGLAIMDLMNATEYDVMVLGNHEFDFGTDVVLENVYKANFPVISANTLASDGGLLLDGINGGNGAYYIQEIAGKKIGFFGITSEETAYKTNPNNLKGTQFVDTIETAKKQVEILKAEGADVIIALVHIGNDASSNPTSIDLANEVGDIDIIIDGHSHTIIQEVVNGVTVVQTGSSLENIGKIQLTFNGDDFTIDFELIDAETLGTYEPDVTVQALYESYMDEIGETLLEVIGNTTSIIYAYAEDGERLCRIEETPMGDLVADSMVYGAKELLKSTQYSDLPVVALQNGGGVRANIYPGDITIADTLSVLPYGNLISIKLINPNKLYATLENGVSKMFVEDGVITGLDGRFPQISGMRIEIDLTKTAYDSENPSAGEGERIVAIYLVDENNNETLLDRNDTTTEIAIVSNDFEVAGGDGYIMLADLKNIMEGGVLDELFAEYISKLTAEQGGSFSYEMDGNRIQVVKIEETEEERIDEVKNSDDSNFIKRSYTYENITKEFEIVNLDGTYYIKVRDLANFLGKEVEYDNNTKITTLK